MGKPLRVVFVEDSENDALLLARELSTSGFDLHSQRVDSAASLNAALDSGDWDLILSDHSMPGFSGLEALEIVRARGADLPFHLRLRHHGRSHRRRRPPAAARKTI